MRMRRALFLAALLPGLWSAVSAYGATVTLKQVASPAVYKPAARAIDVLGIVPGMPPEAVRAILTKEYGAVDVTQSNLGLENQGIAVATEDFVTKMSARKGADEITVWFATPTTGNGVVGISRQTNHFDPATAPELAQVRAELIGKYGPPVLEGPAVGTGEVTVLAWSYGGDKPAPCPRSACRADVSDGPQVADMAAYRRALQAGRQLTIIATLLAGVGNANHASSVVVAVSDVATKLRTLEAAISQMKSATSERPPEKAPAEAERTKVKR
jgi:hypothetical protein